MVYVDELLLVNFAAAAAFLLGAGLLCGQRCSPARLLAGSAAGAAASLALLAPEAPFALALLYKVSSCAAMVALAYGWPGARGFARLCVWVVGLSLALTGAALLPGALVQSNNLSAYVSLSPGLLLLCCGGVYAALRVGQMVFGNARAATFDAELTLAGCCVPVRVFCDTGFTVQDAFTGRAVVLVRYEPVREALPEPLREYLDAYFSGETAVPGAKLGVRLVPCGTVAGSCLLPAVRAALRRRTHRRTPICSELLAAFAAGLPPAGWTALVGEATAQSLGVG